MSGSRWTPKRVQIVNTLLTSTWIGPGAAAVAIGRSRGTVHNMMCAGELRCARLGGSKNRSVAAADLLVLVRAEMIIDIDSGAWMDCCSHELIEAVRRVVETNEQTNAQVTAAAPSGYGPGGPISLDVAVRRSRIMAKRTQEANERRTNEQTANERRTNERTEPATDVCTFATGRTCPRCGTCSCPDEVGSDLGCALHAAGCLHMDPGPVPMALRR
jgi:hypothetical protein